MNGQVTWRERPGDVARAARDCHASSRNILGRACSLQLLEALAVAAAASRAGAASMIIPSFFSLRENITEVTEDVWLGCINGPYEEITGLIPYLLNFFSFFNVFSFFPEFSIIFLVFLFFHIFYFFPEFSIVIFLFFAYPM